LPVPDYDFDLGSYAREVTTSSAAARAWFTRGLLWTYAFNHEEAVRCFERAIADDPDCALAHWGLAYALGPNYNKPWEDFDPADLSSSVSRAFAASAAAASRAPGASAVERALVHALAARYPADEPAADCSAWNTGYADAMRDAYRAHPGDPDVAALFADALMNLTPWALWDLATGEPADGAGTVEAREVLERALARAGRIAAAPSISTTGSPTTSRGPGCSRPGMPAARCCSNRGGSRRLRLSTGPTSGWMTPWPGPASIRATSGACTATTNA
jgi:tetratricopeptide (TPR) repeat protein